MSLEKAYSYLDSIFMSREISDYFLSCMANSTLTNYGNIYTFLGQGGCGKTTLFKLINMIADKKWDHHEGETPKRINPFENESKRAIIVANSIDDFPQLLINKSTIKYANIIPFSTFLIPDRDFNVKTLENDMTFAIRHFKEKILNKEIKMDVMSFIDSDFRVKNYEIPTPPEIILNLRSKILKVM